MDWKDVWPYKVLDKGPGRRNGCKEGVVKNWFIQKHWGSKGTGLATQWQSLQALMTLCKYRGSDDTSILVRSSKKSSRPHPSRPACFSKHRVRLSQGMSLKRSFFTKRIQKVMSLLVMSTSPWPPHYEEGWGTWSEPVFTTPNKINQLFLGVFDEPLWWL